jgi:hypothetical protein
VRRPKKIQLEKTMGKDKIIMLLLLRWGLCIALALVISVAIAAVFSSSLPTPRVPAVKGSQSTTLPSQGAKVILVQAQWHRQGDAYIGDSPSYRPQGEGGWQNPNVQMENPNSQFPSNATPDSQGSDRQQSYGEKRRSSPTPDFRPQGEGGWQNPNVQPY